MPSENTDQNKNDIFIKFKSNQPLNRMKDRYAVIGYSLGYGLNNGKKIDSEEVLAEKIARELNKHNPKKIIILIGDTLSRWNYQYLITHISDDELKKRLEDIPDDLNEEKLAFLFAEKFIDIAELLGKKDFDNLKHHFAKILDLPTEKIEIKHWNERHTTENYNDKIATDPTIVKMTETKKRFLANKMDSLKLADERVKKAQPKLAPFNFDKVHDISSEQFIREEDDYSKHLENTDFNYPAKCPETLKPNFEKNNNCWREYSFKKRNLEKMQREVKKLKKILASSNHNNPLASNSCITTARLCRAHSSSALETTNHLTLASRRAKFFTPLDTKNLVDENESKTNSTENKIFIDTAKLSPKSAERLITFLNLYTQNPGSPEKEKALQKIEEANALLAPRASA